MANDKRYPVSVTGALEQPLSRWLFLVKWLLLIPHFIVLAFLLVAAVVAVLIALFAITFTGRYPRGLFDFNLGVLRWGWRVGFYGYSALASDRYPPFTLQDVDYPARITVEYPERLHRGLVWVKWILAIPHIIIVSIFQGHGNRYAGGLVGILALIAAIVNLFRGKYPTDLYNVILGLNRWTLRVYAYMALMTDDYPPFRLDE